MTSTGRAVSASVSSSPRWLGEGSLLVAGAAVNGLAAYAFLALGTREYGASGFAALSVLWSIWAIAAAAVTFPIQHEVTRRLESGRGEAPVRDVLPLVSAVVVATSAGVTIAAWQLAEPLFGSPRMLNPLMAGWIVLGAGLSGLVRGSLAGRRHFLATGAAIGAENVVRLVGACVVLAMGWSVELYTLALGLGPVAMLVWVGSLRFASTGHALEDEHGLRGLARTFGGLAGSSVISQVVLTSSPVVLALGGGSRAAVTSLFAALAVFRAPYLLLLGAAARITGALTQAVVQGETARLVRTRWLFVGGAGLVAVTFLAVSVTIGEPVLQVLFGPTVELDRGSLGMLGIGTGLAIGAILLVLLSLARNRSSRALGAWMLALVPAAVVLATRPTDEVGTVVGAFVAAELTAVGLLTLLDLWSARSERPTGVSGASGIGPAGLNRRIERGGGSA